MGHENTHHSAGPIWLAALVATGCRAVSDRECHPIGWHLVAGRAVYTNLAEPAEEIQPLGITIALGETLAVTWEPGETEYTLRVDPPEALCA